MTPPSWDEIKHRIAARTGLTLDDEIEAYAHFCEHADTEDGVLLEGDVQHEFYQEFMTRCGVTEREIETEKQFYKENIDGKHVKWPYPESPITLMARDSMEYYRTLFEEKDLVSAPQQMRKIPEPVRVLRSYNYFNDPDFYTKKIDGNSVSLTLVMR